MVASGGVGVAGLVVGISSGLMALSDARTAEEHCWEMPTRGCDETGGDANSRGQILAVVSPIGVGVAAVGLGIATYLGLSGDESLLGGTSVDAYAGEGAAHLTMTQDW